jgi:hypothetical protein
MKRLEQIAMFDLPPAQEKAREKRTERRNIRAPARRNGKRAKQLPLNVRFYVVRSGVGECTVQAPSPSAAKYLAFKVAKEAGLYCYKGGFIAFVGGGLKVAELRH